MDSLYIVIPAYNEEENMERVLDDWYSIVEKHNGGGKSRLVIIDDGSEDRTYEILQRYGKTHSYLTSLIKPNGGHGATVLYGYHYALEHGADYVFQTDSDGQTLPSEFEEFWNLRQSYDMVIGKRNKREDGISRVIVTKILKLVVRVCFGVSVADANTPYRLMKGNTLAKYIELIPDGFNLSNVLLTVIYAKKQCKVKFLPVTFRPRQGGTNSINLPKIFKIGCKAFSDFREINHILK